VSRSPASSRGRTLRSATRPITRSTSTVRLSASAMVPAVRGSARNASMPSCRSVRRACARSGCVSQFRSSRLPAAVAHASSSECSVGASSPLSVTGDLQVAARRRVERHERAPGLDGQRAHVRQRRLLRRACVVQQRAGRADGERDVVGAEPARSSVPSWRATACCADLRRIAMRAATGTAARVRAAPGHPCRPAPGAPRGRCAPSTPARVRQRDLGQRERADAS